MVLLNGELGGMLPAAADLSKITEIINQQLVEYPLLMRELIYSLVSVYGHIPKRKIIIEDIENRVKNTVRWGANSQIYLVPPKEANEGFILTPNEPMGKDYQIYKFNDNIGYVYSDFVYPGKNGLPANVGESVVTLLDKIKNTFGNYEYFFDIDGNFHF
jgi:hypothetical protein